MLHITIPASKTIEFYDEQKEEFITIPACKEQKIQLEHSLVSLSKWESKWHKPFLSAKGMNDEETLDYIRCMTLTQNVPPESYDNITSDIIDKIKNYINDPMTATWFAENKGGKSNGETITAELIYYWMIALNIPFECRKWHLNKLLTLIRVCNIKNTPPKKMGRGETMRRNAALNAARRKRHGSRG